MHSIGGVACVIVYTMRHCIYIQFTCNQRSCVCLCIVGIFHADQTHFHVIINTGTFYFLTLVGINKLQLVIFFYISFIGRLLPVL